LVSLRLNFLFQPFVCKAESKNVERQRGGARRKRTRLENSIGGFVAHKIFQYKPRDLTDDPKASFWRAQ